jgi:hypothetical protein
MSASVQKSAEMEPISETTPESNEMQTDESGSAENTVSELEMPHWSIVSFEGVAMSNLPYNEARKWLEKLNEQNISGLCVVTDDAAARMAK